MTQLTNDQIYNRRVESIGNMALSPANPRAMMTTGNPSSHVGSNMSNSVLPFPTFSSNLHPRTLSGTSVNVTPTPAHSRGQSSVASPLRNLASASMFDHVVSPMTPQPQSSILGGQLQPKHSSSSLAHTLHHTALPLPLPPVKDRVIAFYRKYNPAKLGNIEDILKSYAGQEAELMTALVNKYGPEEIWWGQATPHHSSNVAAHAHAHAVGGVATGGIGASSPNKQQIQQQQVQQPFSGRQVNPNSMMPMVVNQNQPQQQPQQQPKAARVPSPAAAAGVTGPSVHFASSTTNGALKQPLDSTTLVSSTTTLSATANSPVVQLTFEQRLLAILQKYDPAKVHLVPQMLQAFRGNEENLITGLQRKYQQQPQQQQPGHQTASVLGLNKSASGMMMSSQPHPAAQRPGTPIQHQAAQQPESQVSMQSSVKPAMPTVQAAQQPVGVPSPSPTGSVNTSATTTTTTTTKLNQHRPQRLNDKLAAIAIVDSSDDEDDVPHEKMNGDAPRVQSNASPAPSSEGVLGSAPVAVPPATMAATVDQKLTQRIDVASVSLEPSDVVADTKAHSSSVVDPGLPPRAAHVGETREKKETLHNAHEIPAVAAMHPPPPTQTRTTLPAVIASSPPPTPLRAPENIQPEPSSLSLRRQTSYRVEPEKPITERRTSADAIVVTPVLLLGHGSGADVERSESRILPSGAPSESSIVAPSQIRKASLSHIPWSSSSVDEMDRRNVSVSPLSRQTSPGERDRDGYGVDHSRRASSSVVLSAVTPAVLESLHEEGGISQVPMAENVGCDSLHLQKRRFRPPIETTATLLQSTASSSSKHARSGGKDGDATKSPVVASERPLWISPSAKGRLSTAYERGRPVPDPDRTSLRSRSAEAMIRRVYSAGAHVGRPSLTEGKTGNLEKNDDDVSTEGAASTLKPQSVRPRTPSYPVVTSVVPASRVRATSTPSKSRAHANQGNSPAKRPVNTVDEIVQTAEEPEVKRHVDEQVQVETLPGPPIKPKRRPNLNKMIYHEISRPSSVNTDMDLLIVDLRREFKPNIREPPTPDSSFTRKTGPSPSRKALMSRSSREDSDSGEQREDATESKSRRRSSSADVKRGPRLSQNNDTSDDQAPLSGRSSVPSKSSPHRAVVRLEHIPKELPYELYSSFRNAKPGHASAWAKAPTKVGIFDVSPRRYRKHHPSLSSENNSGDINNTNTNESDRVGKGQDEQNQQGLRYDEFGRRLKIIPDVPVDKEAIEAQRLLVHRLSIPKPIYIRKEDGV